MADLPSPSGTVSESKNAQRCKRYKLNEVLQAVLNSDDGDNYPDLSDGSFEYYAQHLYISLCSGNDQILQFTILMEKKILWKHGVVSPWWEQIMKYYVFQGS